MDQHNRLLAVVAVLSLTATTVPPQALDPMVEGLTDYRIETAREIVASRLPVEDATAYESDTPPIVVTVAAAPSTPKTPAGVHLTEQQMIDLIAAYFPAEYHTWALNVSKCESGWYTTADNPVSTAAGLFQFLRSTWDWVAGITGTASYDAGGVWDIDSQMRNAAWLVVNGGKQHWVCKA